MPELSRRAWLGLTTSVLSTGGLTAHAFSQRVSETVIQGRGEPVDRPEVQDVHEKNVSYLGNGQVEIVLARDGAGNPIETTTEPVEKWLQTACGDVLRLPVSRRLRDALDHPPTRWQSISIEARQPRDESLTSGVVVEYPVTTNHGWPIEQPEWGFETVVEATPATASGRIRFEGLTHECTLPVWVERSISDVGRPSAGIHVRGGVDVMPGRGSLGGE